MRRIAFIFIAVLLASTILAYADQTVYGKVQKFDYRTGRIVLVTKAENEARFTITRDTRIFINIKGKEIQKDWDFLEDNMGPGTEVKLILSNNTVTKVVVLEVPR